jgi:hypothetical protein
MYDKCDRLFLYFILLVGLKRKMLHFIDLEVYSAVQESLTETVRKVCVSTVHQKTCACFAVVHPDNCRTGLRAH